MTAPHAPHPPFTCRVADLAEIFDLRWRILRPGMAMGSAQFDADHEPTTLHVGAFDSAGRCIGCTSAMLAPWQDRPAYQLRGMATRPDWRSRGVGRTMLRFVEQHIRSHTHVRLLWCNARTEASAFYEKNHWHIASDVFHIPTVGPHYRMTRHLPPD